VHVVSTQVPENDLLACFHCFVGLLVGLFVCLPVRVGCVIHIEISQFLNLVSGKMHKLQRKCQFKNF